MRALMLIAALALGGCGLTPEGTFVRSSIAAQGAEAADRGLENALWWVCYGSPVGAIKRRWGGSPEHLRAWVALCREGDAVEALAGS